MFILQVNENQQLFLVCEACTLLNEENLKKEALQNKMMTKLISVQNEEVKLIFNQVVNQV